MNPYINQGNQDNTYLQNAYNPQTFMNNIPSEVQSVMNGFSPQKAEHVNVSPQQLSFQQSNPSTLMANMMAKRQMYGEQQEQPLPFHSSTNPSPAISSMAIQSPYINQQWMHKQPMNIQRIDEQQRQQQLLLMQQQQQQQQQSPKTGTKSPLSANTDSNDVDAETNTKRVGAVLALNVELIRLCVESRQNGTNLESNLPLYQAKLQSNLTYLATMADVSMAKPGEDNKSPQPPPPDFSPLPPPKSDIGRKIHELYNAAQKLFEDKIPVASPQESPSMQRLNQQQLQQQQQQQQQQLFRHQAATMRQQQLPRNGNKSGSNSANSSTVSTPTSINGIRNTMDPQTMLRQNQHAQNLVQLQLRQQQMMAMNNVPSPVNNHNNNVFGPVQQNVASPNIATSLPNDLLAANGMINPNGIMMNPNMMMNPNDMMNMYNNGAEDATDYNMAMLMQRLQQQQQQPPQNQ